MEEVVFKALKSVTQPFRVGESFTFETMSSIVSMYRIRLADTQTTTLQQTRNSSQSASVALPSTLLSELDMPTSSSSAIDIIMHVFQNAPVLWGVEPATPLVGVTMSLSGSTHVLNVSGLSHRINITLPLTAHVSNDADLRYECLYWNGSGYSTEGCSATGVWTAASVQCSCNHLTTFVARVRMRVCACGRGMLKANIRQICH